MHVIKRNGRHERVQFDKITSRIAKLAYNLNTQFVDPGELPLQCWEEETKVAGEGTKCKLPSRRNLTLLLQP
jgi:hypothetical protein